MYPPIISKWQFRRLRWLAENTTFIILYIILYREVRSQIYKLYDYEVTAAIVLKLCNSRQMVIRNPSYLQKNYRVNTWTAGLQF